NVDISTITNCENSVQHIFVCLAITRWIIRLLNYLISHINVIAAGALPHQHPDKEVAINF
uniref:hypothetical protein n=1 Tax=Yersinia bercovieri TaxID=634 RepID=UPI0011A872FB